ncbi:SpoIIE family protein phosphatase [Streptomyces sp. fd1-xmd]|uniref:SpoIIE family protein phosphatase n=1 Tax=Streptomyces sp. fd1-xmd TaxID=1812480 RepID=UPI0009906293|nr:SpoIIE family protein phosphatase [Streptomyces sp. fd1-xmd]AQT70461.1 protein phosphatase [Streptomyces sp. fd1-xmd]
MGRGDSTSAVDGPEAALLEALFGQSPVGLHVLDTDLRIVRINAATPAMRHVRMQDVVGRRFEEVYLPLLQDAAAAASLVRGVLDSGHPVVGHVVQAHPATDPGRRNFYEISAFRLQAPLGQVLGVALIAVDVSERERGRARTAVLDAVRREVGRSLDMVATCQELVDTLVPAFADVAVVEVVDAVVRGEEPRPSPLAPGVPLRRAAFRSSGDAGAHEPQAHLLGDVRSLPAPTPYTQALADLRPRVVALDGDLPWVGADPDRTEAIRRSGAHTLITAPLAVRGTVLGLISLYRTRQPVRYDAPDADLVLQLADHTALCIDNARRYTREHAIAATVQRHLLPRRPLSRTALETEHLLVPAEGVGQWYDTIALSGARTALVVGTVAGSGIHTATAMGQLRTAIRSLTAFDLPPDELLARLHGTVASLAAERAGLPPSDPLHQQVLTATCAYAVHDPLNRTLTVVGAGSPALTLIPPDGRARALQPTSGSPLGGPERTPFAASTFDVPDESLVVLSTLPVPALDVLGRSPNTDGRPLADLRDDVLYALPPESRTTPAAILLARTRAFPAENVATWQLQAAPTAAATARHHVRRQLTAWNVPEQTALNTELIVSELVTNAVRYGKPPLELRLLHDRTLACELRDAGVAAPTLRHAGPADEGGRGLFIVGELADDWGVRYDDHGKTIWTEQSLPPRR